MNRKKVIIQFAVAMILAALCFLFQKLGHWVGAALTWLLLVPFFYIACSTMRLGYLVMGIDPMERKLDRSCDSYWRLAPQPVRNEAYYRRQS
ncbi:MAG: hypothetical protein EOL87_10685 [Spartobacteria bacterium]|nr:hypothetical protein [Spartobacteria bacterium]